jgi:hypothetical protein
VSPFRVLVVARHAPTEGGGVAMMVVDHQTREDAEDTVQQLTSKPQDNTWVVRYDVTRLYREAP